MLTDQTVLWQVDEEEKLLVQRHEDGSELRWHILRMVWALCGDSEKGAVDGVGDPKGVIVWCLRIHSYCVRRFTCTLFSWPLLLSRMRTLSQAGVAVVTWGMSTSGGDSSGVQDQIANWQCGKRPLRLRLCLLKIRRLTGIA